MAKPNTDNTTPLLQIDESERRNKLQDKKSIFGLLNRLSIFINLLWFNVFMLYIDTILIILYIKRIHLTCRAEEWYTTGHEEGKKLQTIDTTHYVWLLNHLYGCCEWVRYNLQQFIALDDFFTFLPFYCLCEEANQKVTELRGTTFYRSKLRKWVTRGHYVCLTH